jgi:hypothetical protein
VSESQFLYAAAGRKSIFNDEQEEEVAGYESAGENNSSDGENDESNDSAAEVVKLINFLSRDTRWIYCFISYNVVVALVTAFIYHMTCMYTLYIIIRSR